MTGICKYCHKPFTVKHPSQRFCSRECKDRWWNRKKPDRHSDPDYYRKYNAANGRRLCDRFPSLRNDEGYSSILDGNNDPVY